MIEHFGRRCQGWFEDDDGHREQCDFRFRFKNCPERDADRARQFVGKDSLIR
ncbi:hypothetical protein ACUOFC_31345 [Escherichia sp. TWPC-MK]